MTARETADALVADQAAILAALRRRDGAMVVSNGAPARLQLKEATN
jgi:hypothetical protein